MYFVLDQSKSCQSFSARHFFSALSVQTQTAAAVAVAATSLQRQGKVTWRCQCTKYSKYIVAHGTALHCMLAGPAKQNVQTSSTIKGFSACPVKHSQSPASAQFRHDTNSSQASPNSACVLAVRSRAYRSALRLSVSEGTSCSATLQSSASVPTSQWPQSWE